MIDAERESFADELSDRLRARADRLEVVPDDPSIWNPTGPSLTPTSSVRVERSSTSWMAIVAAVCLTLAVVGGSALLRRSATDDTAAVEASALVERVSLERLLAVGAQPGADEMIVWMAAIASDEEITAVAERLDSFGGVEEYRYVDRAETFAEFEAFWADSPEVIDAVSAEDLPTSFRVVASDPLAVVELLNGLPGVLSSDLDGDAAETTVDEADEGDGSGDGQDPVGSADADRLFLLPAASTPMSPSFGYAAIDDSLIEQPLAAPVVVGRQTELGFDRIVSVSIESDSPAGVDELDETLVVGDRVLERTFDGWAEPLTDGTWLVFQSVAGIDAVSEVASAATVVDGGLVIDETALAESEVLATLPVTPASGQVTISPNPDPALSGRASSGPELAVFTALVSPEVSVEQLVIVGALGQSIESVEIRSVPGWIVRSSDEGLLGGPLLVWLEPTGHLVSVTQPFATEAELVEIAEGLRVVDRETWEAELSARGGTAFGE